MASTIEQRLCRYNGTDYDTIHLETEAGAVIVQEAYTSPLNTDQLTLGMNTVYFTAYPDLKWCVDHLDGDYAYLGLYNASETTAFGADATYSGSTIAAKCTDFLNNTIPLVADYLENVTVEGVTNKVFIPTYYQFSGNTGYGDTSGPVFDYPSASATNREACYAALSDNTMWLSSTDRVSLVRRVFSGGYIGNGYPSFSYGFRPEVKVRYRGTTTDSLDNVLDDLGNRIINGGTSAPTTQPVGGLWFEDLT